MKIVLADILGFCYGVKRAINLAQKNYDSNVFTLGKLIHNEDEVKRLNNQNIFSKDLVNQIPKESTVIIRSHGETPKNFELLKDNQNKIVDATCPYVKKIHRYINNYSNDDYNVIIIGSKNHPEVLASIGRAKGSIFAFNNIDEIDAEIHKIKEPILLVAQTTINVEIWEKCKEYLESKFNDIVSINTICSATKDRQTAARNLAKKVDCVIVIGGKKSSNTNKLYEISKSINKNTFFLENKSEIIMKNFSKYDTIGITAGASTPDWVINDVVNTLLEESEE